MDQSDGKSRRRWESRGLGNWLDRGTGAEAFAAALKFQAGVRSHHTIGPFAEAGVGLYHASFDTTATNIPDFYLQRMPSPRSTTSTFTDPSFIVGGGVNVFASRHISISPVVELMIVRRDSESHYVTAIAAQFAYHFEDHPVTPARRTR